MPLPADDATAKRRRRGRRGGRGRGKGRAATIPATLEHSPDGLVIRIDAAILESAVYREHWVDLASGVVAISASGITLSTATDDDDERVDEDADAATDEG